MLFSYELKKIWRRVSPLLALIILVLTTVATMVLTTIFFNHAPQEQPDVSMQYAALQTKVNNWDTTLNRESFAEAFDNFYHDYKVMNASTLYDLDKLVDNYNVAQQSFLHFYLDYYSNTTYGIKQNVNSYLLVKTKYINDFDNILTRLNTFFDLISPTNDTIIDGLKSTNSNWEDANLQTILDNLFFVQKIKPKDLTELQNFFSTHPANQTGYDYTNAYDYALNRFWLSVATASTYNGDLSEYEGFSDYKDVTTSTRTCALAEYRLEHETEDFATPYQFGNIYNNSQQVSLFDFIFTNMEMAMIPLVILIMIWSACTFFTDNFQNTLITPVTAGKKRSTIILTKTSVILMLTALALLLLVGIYATCGLLFFHACISPDVLFLFNGTTAMTMSATNYFVIYYLDLIFKMLPLIAICGLFSFVKNQPFVIVGFTTLICIAVVLTNFLLGNFWFYQFVPLMGLDPLRYFGAELLLAPMPTSYNPWYTFPAMAAITVIMYGALIHIFRHHDF